MLGTTITPGLTRTRQEKKTKKPKTKQKGNSRSGRAAGPPSHHEQQGTRHHTKTKSIDQAVSFSYYYLENLKGGKILEL